MSKERPLEIREPFDLERYIPHYEDYVVDYEKSSLHEIVYKLNLPGFEYKYDRTGDKSEYSIPFVPPEHVYVSETSITQSDSSEELESILRFFIEKVKWLEFEIQYEPYKCEDHVEYKLIPMNAIMKIDTVKDNKGCMRARFKKLEWRL